MSTIQLGCQLIDNTLWVTHVMFLFKIIPPVNPSLSIPSPPIKPVILIPENFHQFVEIMAKKGS